MARLLWCGFCGPRLRPKLRQPLHHHSCGFLGQRGFSGCAFRNCCSGSSAAPLGPLWKSHLQRQVSSWWLRFFWACCIDVNIVKMSGVVCCIHFAGLLSSAPLCVVAAVSEFIPSAVLELSSSVQLLVMLSVIYFCTENTLARLQGNRRGRTGVVMI